MQLPSFQWFCCFLALMRMWGKIDLNVTFDSCVFRLYHKLCYISRTLCAICNN